MEMDKLLAKAKPENKDEALWIAVDAFEQAQYGTDAHKIQHDLNEAHTKMKKLIWEGVKD